jgi:dimethylhistidine N-methyltransferase
LRNPSQPYPRNVSQFFPRPCSLAILGIEVSEMIARELIAPPPCAFEVEQGLTSSPKSLPPKLFYDQRGSELFEDITQLPEYYPTRTELTILCDRSRDILAAAGQGLTLVELGAGTAAKTTTLLRALSATQLRVQYFPVDISRTALLDARQRIEVECPRINVRPVVADFSNGFSFLRSMPGPKLVLYLGSSIGNFDPDEAVSMLRQVTEHLDGEDRLLLGTDMVKDLSVLLPAYDDAQGVTAEFNRNVLHRLNREFGGDFDADSFAHIALWNPEHSRIEMHLESTKPQMAFLRLLNLPVPFKAGERIHTENSYKYTLPAVERMLSCSGLTLTHTWMDRRQWFGLHLARP